MNNLKFAGFYKLVALLSMLVIFSSSCKKDDEDTSDYAGTWITAKTVAGSSGFVLVDYSLTLTDHAFTETFLTSVGMYSKPSRFVTMEGSVVSLPGNIMKLVVRKVSHSTYNSDTSVASEPYETFTFEDQNFGFEFEGIGMSTSNHKIEYEIINNQLTIKVDYNRDGIYAENEKSIYTKQ